MTSLEAKQIIAGFKFDSHVFGSEDSLNSISAPASVGPVKPIQFSKIIAHEKGDQRDRHHFWSDPEFLEDLPDNPGVYFIVFKESSKHIENPSISEIVWNVKLNNTIISRSAGIDSLSDGELTYYRISLDSQTVAKEALSVNFAESYPSAHVSHAEAISKLSLANRILKIGRAKLKRKTPREGRQNGIRNRISSYKAMQYPITRYILGTDIYQSMELFFITTCDNDEAESLESLLIQAYLDEYQTTPPWEQ